jgi:hypothetical protein
MSGGHMIFVDGSSMRKEGTGISALRGPESTCFRKVFASETPDPYPHPLLKSFFDPLLLVTNVDSSACNIYIVMNQ